MVSFIFFIFFQLPDGRVIKVGGEQFGAPEVLFQPNLIDKESVGISEMLFNTIQAAPIDTRSDFYKYIVLSGGSTMYPGLPSRLERELKQLCVQNVLKGDATGLSVGFKFPLFSVIRISNSVRGGYNQCFIFYM